MALAPLTISVTMYDVLMSSGILERSGSVGRGSGSSGFSMPREDLRFSVIREIMLMMFMPSALMVWVS